MAMHLNDRMFETHLSTPISQTFDYSLLWPRRRGRRAARRAPPRAGPPRRRRRAAAAAARASPA
jgi:hypothetical protein